MRATRGASTEPWKTEAEMAMRRLRVPDVVAAMDFGPRHAIVAAHGNGPLQHQEAGFRCTVGASVAARWSTPPEHGVSPLGPPRGRIATAGGQCMCMLDKIDSVLLTQRHHRSRQGIGTQMGLTGRFQLSGCGVEATPLPGCRSKTSHADCVSSSAPQLPQGQPSRSHSSRGPRQHAADASSTESSARNRRGADQSTGQARLHDNGESSPTDACTTVASSSYTSAGRHAA